ncbi:MAG: HipA N-terminal domain-containing protein [Acidimicrobiales bacterium]
MGASSPTGTPPSSAPPGPSAWPSPSWAWPAEPAGGPFAPSCSSVGIFRHNISVGIYRQLSYVGIYRLIAGSAIGELSRSRRAQLGFGYSEAVRAELAGAPVLSVSMPVRTQPYAGAVPAAYFEGLLPEGEARRMIA